jgi:predicted secreted hydrolase
MNEVDVILPKDTGVHKESNIEWWYNFAFLTGDKGGRYAIMASFFQVGEPQFNKGNYLIYSLIDLNKKTQNNFSLYDSKLKWNMLMFYLPFYLLLNSNNKKMKSLFKELLSGKTPYPHKQLSNAKISSKPTTIKYGDNVLRFLGEKEESFEMHLLDNFLDINLEFAPCKPISLIGGDGKPDDLFYYSFTNNLVQGRIRTEQGIENVKGKGWFDHQWGRDKGIATGIGWNWFGIQLEDGRELLLNEKHYSGSKKFAQMGNLIDVDGTVTVTRDVTFQEIKYWHSINTKTKYPVKWKITIPEFSIELYVTPVFSKQEMPVLGPLQAIWEGACTVTGHELLPGGIRKPLNGHAFMELVGYAL